MRSSIHWMFVSLLGLSCSSHQTISNGPSRSAHLTSSAPKVLGATVTPKTKAEASLREQRILDGIINTIHKHQRSIRYCYEMALASQPECVGTLTLEWEIDATGTVAKPDPRPISGSMSSPALVACLVSGMKSWVFPSPGQRTIAVRYPFEFRVPAAGVRPRPERQSPRLDTRRGDELPPPTSENTLAAVVKRHQADLLQCYRSAFTGRTPQTGTVVLEWTIEPAGSVSNVEEIYSTFTTAALSSCVQGRIKSWGFPGGRHSDLRVRHVFDFDDS